MLILGTVSMQHKPRPGFHTPDMGTFSIMYQNDVMTHTMYHDHSGDNSWLPDVSNVPALADYFLILVFARMIRDNEDSVI